MDNNHSISSTSSTTSRTSNPSNVSFLTSIWQQDLQPGERREDIKVAFGTDDQPIIIQFVGRVSSNFGIFTLKLLSQSYDDDVSQQLFAKNENTSLEGRGCEDNEQSRLKPVDESTTSIKKEESSTSHVVDFVLKTSDGWTISQIDSIIDILTSLQWMDQQKKRDGSDEKHEGDIVRTDGTTANHSKSCDYTKLVSIQIEGYPERMRARHVNETTPKFIHAQRICISSLCDENNDKLPNSSSSSSNRQIRVDEFLATPSPSKRKLSSIIATSKAIQSGRNNSDTTTGSTTVLQYNPNTQRGANDYSRFAKVVSFLLEEFGGYDGICKHGPVVDVAGGAGGLAFELAVRHSIDCVVVDTKTVRFNPRQIKHLQYRQDCATALQHHNHQSPLAEHLFDRFSLTSVDGIATIMDANDADDARQNKGTGRTEPPSSTAVSFSAPEESRSTPSPHRSFLRQFKTLLDSQDILDNCSTGKSGLSHCTANRQPPPPHRFLDDPLDMKSKMDDKSRLRSLLLQRQCSVIVGLHPDEGLDPIIDVALELSIPFVVIPCCVFPSLFRERRTRDGRVVRNYDDLCCYILGRDPNIQETTLPFRGRNRVFYWKPTTSY